jgi:precorrin-4 methylase
MAVAQRTINIVTSVDNLLAVVVGIIVDVKAGKAPLAVVTDAVPSLVAALGTLNDLSADVADRTDLETTVAVRLAQVVSILSK